MVAAEASSAVSPNPSDMVLAALEKVLNVPYVLTSLMMLATIVRLAYISVISSYGGAG